MQDEDGWISTTATRKRFREEKEEKEKPKSKRMKKAKPGVMDDEEFDEWENESSSLEELDSFSQSLEEYISIPGPPLVKAKKEQKEKKPPPTKSPARDRSPIHIDLFAETANLRHIIKDTSRISLPSKDEVSAKRDTKRRRESNYKHDEVVRVKKTRESMPGHQCEMCQKFYNALDPDLIDKSSLVDMCSRHRYNYSPPPTPPGYWDVDFPELNQPASQDSFECDVIEHTEPSEEDKPVPTPAKRKPVPDVIVID